MKVATYCRVSTDRSDQSNSFESQCRYFADYIAKMDGWELYKVYADEGLSGTGTDKRSAFREMIRDAQRGCFELILTKEVSRFSRNILDTIYYTRELKRHNVFVCFANDGINTSEPDSELRLSIMGSIAQEESRKTSARVKWGQQRRMEQGVVFGHSMLGYDVCDGKLHINPEGAAIVREIFESYAIKDKSSSKIAEEMLLKGHKFSPSRIIKILKNEKYMGDLVQKKTYTPDYLSHKKKYNHGEEDLVIIKNHHEAIIGKELWEAAQTKIRKNARRKGSREGRKKQHYSGYLSCAVCSSNLIAKKRQLKESAVVYWMCPNKGCSLGRRIRNDAVDNMLVQAADSLGIDQDSISLFLLLESIRLYPDKAILKLKYLPHEWVFRV